MKANIVFIGQLMKASMVFLGQLMKGLICVYRSFNVG